MTNEKVVGFIPSSINLTDIINQLKIPGEAVIKTKEKVDYDRYLLKIGSGNKVKFKCVSKQKYFGFLKKNGLPITSVFIDYESWFYSLKLNYKERPNLTGFFDEVSNFGTIKHIYFFGNFTEEMRGELVKIRRFTNNIIECYGHESKEFSDVIMLDYIYRYVFDFPKIEQYILFTNDGHFLPLINTLQNHYKKKVITAGVQYQTSLLLYSTSQHHITVMPQTFKDIEKYWFEMLKGMWYSENNGRFVTFNGTLEYNIKRGLEESIAYQALNKLIDDGYVTFEPVNISGRTITVMYANWAKLRDAGIFDFQKLNYG